MYLYLPFRNGNEKKNTPTCVFVIRIIDIKPTGTLHHKTKAAFVIMYSANGKTEPRGLQRDAVYLG
jgi:hypothetical protein